MGPDLAGAPSDHATVRHARRHPCSSSVEVASRTWLDAVRQGEHAGAFGFTGVLAVGELDPRRAIERRCPLFSFADLWGRLTRGPRSSVTVE